MRVRLPVPHTGQQVVLSSEARFRWLSAGRRWRKTTLLMMVAVEAATRGQHILWGAPTYDQCRIGWTEMYRSSAGVADFKIGRMEVLFPNDGAVIFRSLDNPDNARGHTADGIILDEAPMIKERAWYEVLRPIISDTDGWLLAAGTPQGRNWFWNEWNLAKEREDSAAWAAPTLGVVIQDGVLVRMPHPLENSDFPFSEAQLLYDTLPSLTFAQEFLAHFVLRVGLVYPQFNRSIHVLHREPGEFQYWAMGLDEGYTNPAVILLVGIDNDTRFHIYKEFYERGKLQEAVIEESVAMARGFPLSAVAVDSSAASLRAGLRNAGLAAEPSAGRVLDGIAALQSLLQVAHDGRPRLTVEPDCTSTIAEFESYSWKPNKDEPVKRDDHAMDGIRYLISHLSQPATTEEVISLIRPIV